MVSPSRHVLVTGYNTFPRGVHIAEVRREPREMGRVYPPDAYIDGSDVVYTDSGLWLRRWDRPAKYQYVEHAERQAIYNAAFLGVSLRGATAYLSWEPRVCVSCARAVIQSGVAELVGPSVRFPGAGLGKFYKFEPLAAELLDDR